MRIGKLKALSVAREKRPGMYNDGGGLYLQVTGAGAKSWVFRYWISERDPTTGELVREPTTNKVRGTSREMGLGSCMVVTLNEARERAAECRRMREKGIDPIEARREARQQGALEKAKALKFRDAAAAYIAAHRAGCRNDKHVRQWENTLAVYADPIIGALSVQAVDTSLMCKVLEPIWTTKPETAGRVRGRIESILDWAKVAAIARVRTQHGGAAIWITYCRHDRRCERSSTTGRYPTPPCRPSWRASQARRHNGTGSRICNSYRCANWRGTRCQVG